MTPEPVIGPCFALIRWANPTCGFASKESDRRRLRFSTIRDLRITSNSHFSGRTGRTPVHYTPERAERICEQLRAGRSLGAICKDEGMPSVGTVQQWVRDNRDGFAARYMRARGERGIRPGILPAYTNEMAMRICVELSAGRSLRGVCRDPGMPNTKTVQRWVPGKGQ